MAKQSRKKPPMVVYLGGVEKSDEIEKTDFIKKAKRFSKFPFLSIGTFNRNGRKLPKNARTNFADWIIGLKKLKDGSVGVLRSHLGLGYYTELSKDKANSFARLHHFDINYDRKVITYTAKVLEAVHTKLKTNGVITIIAENGGRFCNTRALNNIKAALKKLPKGKQYILVSEEPLADKEAQLYYGYIAFAFSEYSRSRTYEGTSFRDERFRPVRLTLRKV